MPERGEHQPTETEREDALVADVSAMMLREMALHFRVPASDIPSDLMDEVVEEGLAKLKAFLALEQTKKSQAAPAVKPPEKGSPVPERPPSWPAGVPEIKVPPHSDVVWGPQDLFKTKQVGFGKLEKYQGADTEALRAHEKQIADLVAVVNEVVNQPKTSDVAQQNWRKWLIQIIESKGFKAVFVSVKNLKHTMEGDWQYVDYDEDKDGGDSVLITIPDTDLIMVLPYDLRYFAGESEKIQKRAIAGWSLGRDPNSWKVAKPPIFRRGQGVKGGKSVSYPLEQVLVGAGGTIPEKKEAVQDIAAEIVSLVNNKLGSVTERTYGNIDKFESAVRAKSGKSLITVRSHPKGDFVFVTVRESSGKVRTLGVPISVRYEVFSDVFDVQDESQGMGMLPRLRSIVSLAEFDNGGNLIKKGKLKIR